jgi:transposase
MLTSSEFSQKGKISSTISDKIAENLDLHLSTEEDYVLSDERKEELTKEVEVKTRNGKVMKTKKEIVFDDLSEEMKYRITNYKKYLGTRNSKSFFNSYRDIVDLDNFSEARTTQ